jgi:putative peptidoglycan lipid II flippase
MIRLPRPRLTPGVRRLLALMAPGLIGAGVVQINLVVDVILASTLREGSVSFLYFADRINQLPLGVVGVAVGVALLPLLTRQLADGDYVAASDSQNRAIEFALILTLPATVALITISEPIVSVLFGRGAFDAAAATNTASALTAFALGLPAYVLIKALTPGFFARQDTATPVKVAIFGLVLNVVLATTLMQVMAHVGIALATACSAWINALALGFILYRRNQLRADPRLRRNAPRALAAAIVMGVLLIFAKTAFEPYLRGSSFEKILSLGGLVVLGLVVYAFAAHLFGAVRVSELRSMLRR